MAKNNIIDSLGFEMLIKDNGFDQKLAAMEKLAKEFNITVSQALEIMSKPPKDPVGGGKPQKEIEGLKRQLADLEKQWGSLNSAQRKGVDGQGLLSQYRALKGEAGQYGGTLNTTVKSLDKATAASEKLKQSQGSIIDTVRRANNDFTLQGRAVSNLNTLFTTYVSIFAVERLVSNIARVRGEFELQQVALRAIIQDAQAADTIFNQIKGLSVESPFQFKELTGYVKQLAAFSIDTDKLFETTSRLADISAGLGVDMGRIILAYGQVRSASVLRGQELRQFTEAGIPLVDKLAKKFSELEGRVVSAGEVFEKISNRQVSFGMVNDILTDLTSDGGMFFEMQAKQSETLAGKLSNLKDAYEMMLNDIGLANEGILKGGVDGLRTLMTNWRGVGTALMAVVAMYGAYRVASALNTQMLGKENQELIQRLMTNKEMIASELRKKAVYSTLSEEEIALTKNTDTLTNADLRNLTANGLLTKSAALRMIATKQLTAAQGQELVGLNLITQTELTQALTTTRLGRAKLALVGIVGKVGSAFKTLWTTMLTNPITWIVVAIQGVVSLFSTMSEHADAINEINNKFDELSKRAASIYGAFSKASDESLFDDQKKQLRALLNLAKEDYRLELDIDFTKLTPQNIIEEFNQLRNELLNAEVFLRTFSKEWQESTEWTMSDDINEDLADLGGSAIAYFDLLKGNVNNTIGVLEGYKDKLNDVQKASLESLKTPQGKDESQLQYLDRLSKAYKTTYGAIVESEAGYSASIRAGSADKQRYIKEVKAIRNVLSEFAVNDKFSDLFSDFNKNLAEGSKEFDNFIKTIEAGVNQLPEEKRTVYLKAAIEKQASENNWNEFVRDYVTKWTNEKFSLKISFLPETPNANLADWQKSLNDKLKNLGYNETTIQTHLEVGQDGFSKARADVISTYQKEKQEIDEINKAKKQGLAYDERALSDLDTKLEIDRKKARLMGISDEELDGSSGSGKDAMAEKIKNQIALLKQAEGLYEKYLKIASKDDALKKVTGDAQFASLGVDFKDYSPADTRQYLNQIYNSIKGNPRFKEIQKELEKLFTELDYDKAKKTVDDFLETIKNELSDFKDKYNFMEELFKMSGNRQMAVDIAFGTTYKGGTDMIAKIKENLNKQLGGASLDLSLDTVLSKDAKDIFTQEFISTNGLSEEAVKQGKTLHEELRAAYRKSVIDGVKALTDMEAYRKNLFNDSFDLFGSGYSLKISKIVNEANLAFQEMKDKELECQAIIDNETDTARKAQMEAELIQIKELHDKKRKNIKTEKEDALSSLAKQSIDDGLDKAMLGTSFKSINEATFRQLKRLKAALKDLNELDITDELRDQLASAGLSNTLKAEFEKADLLGDLMKHLKSGADKIPADLLKSINDKGLQGYIVEIENAGLSIDELIKKRKEYADATEKDVADQDWNKTAEAMGATSESLGSMLDILHQFGVNIPELDAFVGGMQTTLDGLASINMDNPATAITGSIKALSGVFEMIFAPMEANKEKMIQESVQQVKRLENAYADLERAMDKALGDDKFKASSKMLNNLASQLGEISKQADLERSKKNSDGEKIDDLDRQYVELGHQIDDLLTSIKDDIIGSTAKDISQELGDAMFEAFANGTDAAEAWGVKVDEIIGNILKKMLISKFLEKPIADAVNKFYEATMPVNAAAQKITDQFNSINQEISELDTTGQSSSRRSREQLIAERNRLKAELDKQLKNAENEVPKMTEDAFSGLENSLGSVGDNFQSIIDALPEDLKKYLFGAGEAGEGLKEGIKGVTEDTASLLASYMNAIRQHVAMHGATLSSTDRNIALIYAAVANMNLLVGSSRNMSTQAILYLKNIEANTFNTAAEAKAIAESSVKTMKAVLDIVSESKNTNSILNDVTSGIKKISIK